MKEGNSPKMIIANTYLNDCKLFKDYGLGEGDFLIIPEHGNWEGYYCRHCDNTIIIPGELHTKLREKLEKNGLQLEKLLNRYACKCKEPDYVPIRGLIKIVRRIVMMEYGDIRSYGR